MGNSSKFQSNIYYIVFNIILSNGCYFCDYYTVESNESREDVRAAALEAYIKAPNEVIMHSSIFYKDKVDALKVNVYTEDEYMYFIESQYDDYDDE